MKGIVRILRNSFKGEDDSFILWTALKIEAIALIILLFIYLMLFNLMKINSYYFMSIGFPSFGENQSIFFEYLTKNIYSSMPWVFAFFVVLFFAGMYVAKSLLRPFEAIASYSEEAIDNKEAIYISSYFNSQRLLASFSEYFFSYIRISRTEKKLKVNLLPPQYTRIHAPVFDKIFFFHFILIIGVMCIFTSWFIQIISADVHSNMVDIALQMLKTKNTTGMASFLTRQSEVIEFYTSIAISITFIFYTILGFHLYSKVSGAAFGFFATMRSFMKGNHSARVHLIGYNYIRPQSRKFNKFLDYVQKNIDVEK